MLNSVHKASYIAISIHFIRKILARMISLKTAAYLAIVLHFLREIARKTLIKPSSNSWFSRHPDDEYPEDFAIITAIPEDGSLSERTIICVLDIPELDIRNKSKLLEAVHRIFDRAIIELLTVADARRLHLDTLSTVKDPDRYFARITTGYPHVAQTSRAISSVIGYGHVRFV